MLITPKIFGLFVVTLYTGYIIIRRLCNFEHGIFSVHVRKDTECQHQEQRCKELGRELERLSSVMQFKDQDIEHLQLRCRTLDGRLSQLQASRPMLFLMELFCIIVLRLTA